MKMEMENNQNKKEIRKFAEKIRNSIPKEEKKKKDEIIRNQLFKWDLYIKSKYLFCYVSFRSEVDTFEIIDKSISDGKIVAVPKIFPKKKTAGINPCIYVLNVGFC